MRSSFLNRSKLKNQKQPHFRVSDIAEERYLEDHLGETSPQMHELKADDPILQSKIITLIKWFNYFKQELITLIKIWRRTEN